MVELITRDIAGSDLKEVVNKLLPDSIAKDIEKACQGIYPLHDVYIRKVKVLKKPRFELSKLLELHGDGGKGGDVSGEGGSNVDKPEGYEPPVQESVWVFIINWWLYVKKWKNNKYVVYLWTDFCFISNIVWVMQVFKYW